MGLCAEIEFAATGPRRSVAIPDYNAAGLQYAQATVDQAELLVVSKSKT